MTGIGAGRRVVIATRGSKLALWQAAYVAGLLGERGVASDQMVIKTTADRIQDRFLHEIGGKGLFVKELEEALASGAAHLAVHSLKDMTASLQAPFALAAIMQRHSPRDVMILRPDVAERLGALPDVLRAEDVARLGKVTVGTGSLRRRAILQRAAPAANTVPIRGNVDTRIRKLNEGAWDAIILAEASLDRLGIRDVTYRALDTDWFIPSPSQGALAIETRADSEWTTWLGQELGDAATTLAVTIERGLLARLGGDCNMPFACHVRDAGSGQLAARAAIYDQEGQSAEAAHSGPPGGSSGEGFLDALTDKIKAAGAGRILGALGMRVPAAFA